MARRVDVGGGVGTGERVDSRTDCACKSGRVVSWGRRSGVVGEGGGVGWRGWAETVRVISWCRRDAGGRGAGLGGRTGLGWVVWVRIGWGEWPSGAASAFCARSRCKRKSVNFVFKIFQVAVKVRSSEPSSKAHQMSPSGSTSNFAGITPNSDASCRRQLSTALISDATGDGLP
ncbi:uncharacterized protein EI90DRAFT_3090966 [Cantharellus anzutake]|uniref:uncharacterized protein n=1 Tax=Cantharellus anzutake TaxID=1750568 RepID=UPI0019087632|nr:uncharacterized protein EI90DRAFT_3090966 [Cantharellus anzutake]KAF8314145.1 hypothetical protein EI90DRAFT_3090966 [Cantharellus anzutake]